MRNYLLIDNDVYFISQRIKEIDKRYFILFNMSKNKYEIHSLGQMGGSYCFTLPYKHLDERAIFYTLKTRCENVEKIIKEIDQENIKLEKNNIKKAVNKLEEVLL